MVLSATLLACIPTTSGAPGTTDAEAPRSPVSIQPEPAAGSWGHQAGPADEARIARAPVSRAPAHVPLVASLAPEDAGSRAAGKVLGTLDEVRGSVQESWYQHQTKIDRKRGKYGWDCSGMTAWILRRTAPKAHEALVRDRPVAKTFLHTIQKAPTDKPKRGWQRIADIEDVRPGDVFAWLRPPDWPGKGATGHVGFVVSRPHRVESIEGGYVVRIVDSTRYPHQDDTRAPDGTGFGFGTILFVVDDTGHPTAYGWHGSRSRGAVTTEIAFGRVTG